MLRSYEIPAPTAVVHVNGQAPAGKTVADQRRALRKLLRDLVAFTGTAINDLAPTPRKATPPKQQTRVLFRRADHLTDADVDRLVVEIGADRLMRALDRWSQPSLLAAE